MEKRSAALAVLLLASLLVLTTAQGNLPGDSAPCCEFCSCSTRVGFVGVQCRCIVTFGGFCPRNCIQCVCDKSNPPLCRCEDTKPTCDAFCIP